MSRLSRLAGAAALAAAGVAIERTMVAAPPYRGPVTDHFDGHRFHNLAGGWQSESSFLKWQATKKPGPWRRWIPSDLGPPPEPAVDGGRLRVTWINHSTLLVQMDGVNVLTDPIWSERCSPFAFAGPRRHRAPGVRFDELPKIDAVVVSHNHYDHLDLPTLSRLRNTRILTPLGNAALLARAGIFSGRDLEWWQSLPISDRVTVTCVPAQHFCARALSDRNATLWGGFVISGPSGHVYFAGDTGWGDHFEQIGRKFDPIRAALLPIGSYLPRWFMKPAHISPEEAVDAHHTLRAQTSIAMHYGTFRLGDDGEHEPAADLRRALKAKGQPRFLMLEHGVGVEVQG